MNMGAGSVGLSFGLGGFDTQVVILYENAAGDTNFATNDAPSAKVRKVRRADLACVVYSHPPRMSAPKNCIAAQHRGGVGSGAIAALRQFGAQWPLHPKIGL
jgi:hypothetical protein